jgi:hypothetical protein
MVTGGAIGYSEAGGAALAAGACAGVGGGASAGIAVTVAYHPPAYIYRSRTTAPWAAA